LLARCNGAEAFDERLEPERIASWEAVEGAGGRHPSDAVEDPWQAQAAIRELLALGSSETNPLKVAEHAAASARRDSPSLQPLRGEECRRGNSWPSLRISAAAGTVPAGRGFCYSPFVSSRTCKPPVGAGEILPEIGKGFPLEEMNRNTLTLTTSRRLPETLAR
jgi:hypothetical protein